MENVNLEIMKYSALFFLSVICGSLASAIVLKICNINTFESDDRILDSVLRMKKTHPRYRHYVYTLILGVLALHTLALFLFASVFLDVIIISVGLCMVVAYIMYIIARIFSIAGTMNTSLHIMLSVIATLFYGYLFIH